MSILNVWLERDRALVGVDTEAVSSAGARMHASKMLALPHINAVLAGRGAMALLGCTFVQLLVTDTGDFDALADRLPAAVKEAFDSSIGSPQMRQLDQAAYLGGHEIVLVGYSPKQERMRAVEVVRRAGAKSFTVEETELHYITPWHDSIASVPDPDDVVAMAGLAMAQVNLIKRVDPAAAGGGRLLFAELSAASMTLRTVCDL